MPLLLLKFLPYIFGFLAVAGVIAGAVSYVSNHWATKAGIEQGRAELQPQLTKCEGEVEKHNQAARVMAEESAKRQAAASKALAKATVAARTWEDNASRLRAVLMAPRKAGEPVQTSCEAAWAEIRGQK